MRSTSCQAQPAISVTAFSRLDQLTPHVVTMDQDGVGNADNQPDPDPAVVAPGIPEQGLLGLPDALLDRVLSLAGWPATLRFTCRDLLLLHDRHATLLDVRWRWTRPSGRDEDDAGGSGRWRPEDDLGQLGDLSGVETDDLIPEEDVTKLVRVTSCPASRDGHCSCRHPVRHPRVRACRQTVAHRSDYITRNAHRGMASGARRDVTA